MTSEQPPGAPSAGSVPVNPYEQLTNAYYGPGRVPGGPPPGAWMPAPARSPAGAIAVGLVAVVMLGFGVAFGATEFAKGEVCDGIASASAPADGPAAGTPAVQATRTTATVKNGAATAAQAQDVEELRADIDVTRKYARMLLLDGDLRAAVDDLTTDAESALRLGEEFKTLSAEERMDNAPRVVDLAADMDTHWRAAQRACGQAETGV